MKIKRKDNCSDAIQGIPTHIIDERSKEMDENAIANLHLTMENVKDIWDTFHKLYEIKSLQTRIFLKRKLCTLRTSESTWVTYHMKT